MRERQFREKQVDKYLKIVQQYANPKVLAQCRAVIPEYVYADRMPYDQVKWMAEWFRTSFMGWAKGKIVRYNRISTLLKTRKGRCGEWANLFTCMLNSIGIKARLVVNTEDDHVWTEVFLWGDQWTHADSTLPFPNSINHPYVYADSMKHNVEQIIAFSPPAGVILVTSRYRHFKRTYP